MQDQAHLAQLQQHLAQQRQQQHREQVQDRDHLAHQQQQHLDQGPQVLLGLQLQVVQLLLGPPLRLLVRVQGRLLVLLLLLPHRLLHLLLLLLHQMPRLPQLHRLDVHSPGQQLHLAQQLHQQQAPLLVQLLGLETAWVQSRGLTPSAGPAMLLSGLGLLLYSPGWGVQLVLLAAAPVLLLPPQALHQRPFP